MSNPTKRKKKKPNKTVVATAGNVSLSLRSGSPISAVPHLDVVQEMKKLIRRSALVGVLLILAIGVFAFLQFRGTIPSFADTSDASYEKLCGFEPSHGRVWTTSSGFGSGGAFYRLNLARSAYSESRATILTESNRPPLPHAPWWWGAKPNGKVSVFLGGGLGFNTQSYQVYDPDKELLYVYCEWD